MTTPEDRSRTARRNAEKALLSDRKDLLDALADLPPEARAAIPAPPDLLAAIEQIAGMRADSARRRIVRHHARRAPEAVWPALFEAHAALKDTPPDEIVSADDDEAATWAARLVDEGDAALADFVDRYPAVDRNHVRRLLRNASNRQGGAADRALFALQAGIKEVLVAEDDED